MLQTGLMAGFSYANLLNRVHYSIKFHALNFFSSALLRHTFQTSHGVEFIRIVISCGELVSQFSVVRPPGLEPGTDGL